MIELNLTKLGCWQNVLTQQCHRATNILRGSCLLIILIVYTLVSAVCRIVGVVSQTYRMSFLC